MVGGITCLPACVAAKEESTEEKSGKWAVGLLETEEGRE